jgi:hypothetical protein
MMTANQVFIASLILVIAGLSVLRDDKSEDQSNQRGEVGKVRWSGSFEVAHAREKEFGKPVFVLSRDSGPTGRSRFRL